MKYGDSNQLIEERNEQIAEGIEGKIATAKGLDPQPRWDRWLRGEQTRVIIWIGNGHRRLPTYLHQQGVDKRMEITYKNYEGSQYPIIDAVLDGMPKPRSFTEREAWICALELKGVSSIINQLEKTDPAASKRLLANTLNLTLEQCRSLDEQCQKIPDRRAATTYLLNVIYGENHFDVSQIHVE
jgi:hypothetical protein